MTANAANPPPGADVSIESMLDIRQQNWRQRILGAQAFWVTVALLLICLGDLPKLSNQSVCVLRGEME